MPRARGEQGGQQAGRDARGQAGGQSRRRWRGLLRQPHPAPTAWPGCAKAPRPAPVTASARPTATAGAAAGCPACPPGEWCSPALFCIFAFLISAILYLRVGYIRASCINQNAYRSSTQRHIASHSFIHHYTAPQSITTHRTCSTRHSCVSSHHTIPLP